LATTAQQPDGLAVPQDLEQAGATRAHHGATGELDFVFGAG